MTLLQLVILIMIMLVMVKDTYDAFKAYRVAKNSPGQEYKRFRYRDRAIGYCFIVLACCIPLAILLMSVVH